jgi:hypothetical protein
MDGIANLFEPGCGIGIPIQCVSEGGHVKKIQFVNKKTERTGSKYGLSGGKYANLV